MVAERLRTRPEQPVFSGDFDRRSKIALANEREIIENSLGLDLTTIIVSNLSFGLLETLPRNCLTLLANLPTYPRFKTANKYISPEEEKKFFAQSFVSNLTKSWNSESDKNLNEKEKRLFSYSSQLRSKGYEIKQVIDSVSKHFSIPIYQDQALYSIKDIALVTGMTNRRQLQHELEFAMARDQSITPQDSSERKKGKRVLFGKEAFYKIAFFIYTKKQPVLLTDNQETIEINGEIRKKILKQLLNAQEQGKPVPMHELLANYSKDTQSPIEKKRYRVLRHLDALREILKDVGLTIKNARNHGHRFRGQESLYVLTELGKEKTTSSPVIVFQANGAHSSESVRRPESVKV